MTHTPHTHPHTFTCLGHPPPSTWDPHHTHTPFPCHTYTTPHTHHTTLPYHTCPATCIMDLPGLPMPLCLLPSAFWTLCAHWVRYLLPLPLRCVYALRRRRYPYAYRTRILFCLAHYTDASRCLPALLVVITGEPHSPRATTAHLTCALFLPAHYRPPPPPRRGTLPLVLPRNYHLPTPPATPPVHPRRGRARSTWLLPRWLRARPWLRDALVCLTACYHYSNTALPAASPVPRLPRFLRRLPYPIASPCCHSWFWTVDCHCHC